MKGSFVFRLVCRCASACKDGLGVGCSARFLYGNLDLFAGEGGQRGSSTHGAIGKARATASAVMEGESDRTPSRIPGPQTIGGRLISAVSHRPRGQAALAASMQATGYHDEQGPGNREFVSGSTKVDGRRRDSERLPPSSRLRSEDVNRSTGSGAWTVFGEGVEGLAQGVRVMGNQTGFSCHPILCRPPSTGLHNSPLSP